MNRSMMFCLLGLITGILIGAYRVFILIIPAVIIFIALMAIFKRPVFIFASVFLITGAILCANNLNYEIRPINKFVGEEISGSFYIKDVVETDTTYSLCDIVITSVNGENIKENVKLYFYGETNPVVNTAYSFEKMKFGAYSKESVLMYGGSDAFYSGNLSLANTEIIGKVKRTPLSIIRVFRQKVNKEIDKTFSKRTSGFIRALFTGDRSKFDRISTENFKDAGISHIIAVSGMHVVILMNILSYITFNRKSLKWVHIIFLLAFVVFTGASPSVIRAGGIYLALFLSDFLERSKDSANILFCVAFITLLISPLSLFSKSFQLSYMACFAVISVAPMFYFENKKKVINYISSSASTSLAVQIMTFPLILEMNSKMSFFVITANLIAITLLPYIYIAGYIALITKIPILVYVTEFMTKFLMFTAEVFSAETYKGALIMNTPVVKFLSSVLVLVLFIYCLDRKSRIIRKTNKSNIPEIN